MIPAVTLSPAPHMAPGGIPAISVSIWSRLTFVMAVVSGRAFVSTMLTKAAAVLLPGRVLLTVLVPAMLSRPDSAFIHSFIHSYSHLFIHSLASWSVHLFISLSTLSCTHSLIPLLSHLLSYSCLTLSFSHSFINSLTVSHGFATKSLLIELGTYSP